MTPECIFFLIVDHRTLFRTQQTIRVNQEKWCNIWGKLGKTYLPLKCPSVNQWRIPWGPPSPPRSTPGPPFRWHPRLHLSSLWPPLPPCLLGLTKTLLLPQTGTQLFISATTPVTGVSPILWQLRDVLFVSSHPLRWPASGLRIS